MKLLTRCRSLPLLFIFILTACVVRYNQAPFLDNFQIMEKVLKNNKAHCLYKKRVVISLKNKENNNKYKFRCLLDNRCEEGLIVNILGIFNQVEAKVIVEPENIIIINNNGNVSRSTIYSYLEEKNIGEIIQLLSFPYILPDQDYEVFSLKEGYLFKKDNIDITINQNYKIVKIKSG